jgi:His-Xaa-Ser system protein HxsD
VLATFDQRMQGALSPPSSTPRCGDVMVIEIQVDLSVYDVDDVTRAAYWFTTEFDVRLTRPSPSTIAVFLERKAAATHGADDASLMVRRFDTALLEERLRRVIAKETAGLRERLWSAALAEATPRGR